jgi:Flp pilus assembly protein TadG
MSASSRFDNLLARVKTFGARQDGNVAVLFGIAILPIMACVGAAVDYTHASSIKAAMQAALDSTALMLSRDAPNKNEAQLEATAKDYFNALFTRGDGKLVTVDALYDVSGGSSLTMKATVLMDTAFMRLFGQPQITLNSSAVVRWGNTKLRVALALDNTGSMAQANKLPALKSATKDLLKMLQTASSKPGDVLVSIVPFAKDVNVGSSNYQANWLRWDEWDSQNGQQVTSEVCDNKGRGRNNCKTVTTWVPSNHNTWNGCVADRDKDYDVTNDPTDPNKISTLYPAEQYANCPIALMPLSSNWTDMNSLVDSMKADGNTNQTIGLAWAWETLTQQGPLNAPAITDKETQQVIILLTDGLNTQSRQDNDAKEIDKRTDKACKNIKAAGIQIYTVLVMEGNASLLQSCASKPDMFFALTSAGQIATAFNTIGTNLSKLRVAK